MNKKAYIFPEMLVVELQHKTGILELSKTQATGLGNTNLTLDKNGGNQTTNAWGKSRGGIWDEQ